MKMKKIVLAMITLGAVQAEAAVNTDYFLDVSLSQSWDRHVNDDDTPTHESTDASATIYFEPVSMASGPFAEAPFLSKSSSVEVGSWHDGETRDRDGHDDFNSDLDFGYLRGRYVVPDIDMIVDATYGRAGDDLNATLARLGIGAYVMDRATLMLDYSHLKNKSRADYDNKFETLALTYHQLVSLGGSQTLAIEPHIKKADLYYGASKREVGVAATWYLTPALGIRAGLDYAKVENSNDDGNTQEYFTGVDYFVTDDIRVGAVLKRLTDVETIADSKGAEIYTSLLTR